MSRIHQKLFLFTTHPICEGNTHGIPVKVENKKPMESIREIRPSSDNSGSEPEAMNCLYYYSGYVSHDSWEEREDEDTGDNLLPPCCTAGGSVDQVENSVHPDEQRDITDCSLPCPDAPVPHGPRPFCSPVSRSVPPLVSTASAVVVPLGRNTWGPTASYWDALRSASRGPGCADGEPASAAAHLHLLGEALSLIGLHLQETNKLVCVSGGLSVLLDSLLCSLAPLLSLTAQIPELRSCSQHSLAPTLENIMYLMPGL